MSKHRSLLALILLTASACATTAGPGVGSTRALPDLATLGAELTRGVGAVQAASASGPGQKRAVVVFEERHASITGQVEIAIMLLRLRYRGGSLVGLEGAPAGERVRAPWRTRATTRDAQAERIEVALQLLQDGEINAAEFLVLVDDDMDVRGLEAPDLYAVDLDVPGWPEAGYLLRLAENAVPQSEASRLAELAAQGRTADVSAKLLEADPWVSARWEEMKRWDTPVEEVASRLRLVRARAEARRVKVEEDLRRDFDLSLRFFEVAARRSEVMVASLSSRLAATADPLAGMIVGAAHGRGVRAALERAGLAVLSIRPASFSSSAGQLSPRAYERKRRGLWAGGSGLALACALNASRKPPPILAKASGPSRLWMQQALVRLTRAHRDHKDLATVVAALPKSEAGAIASAHTDGSDIVVQLSLITTSGRRTMVWARAHARTGLEGLPPAEEDREKTLLTLLARLREGRPAADSADEPGAMLLGRDVRAIFGPTEDAVAPSGFKTAVRDDDCP